MTSVFGLPLKSVLLWLALLVAVYIFWNWWNDYAGTVDGTGHSRGFWNGVPFTNWNQGA